METAKAAVRVESRSVKDAFRRTVFAPPLYRRTNTAITLPFIHIHGVAVQAGTIHGVCACILKHDRRQCGVRGVYSTALFRRLSYGTSLTVSLIAAMAEFRVPRFLRSEFCNIPRGRSRFRVISCVIASLLDVICHRKSCQRSKAGNKLNCTAAVGPAVRQRSGTPRGA